MCDFCKNNDIVLIDIIKVLDKITGVKEPEPMPQIPMPFPPADPKGKCDYCGSNYEVKNYVCPDCKGAHKRMTNIRMDKIRRLNAGPNPYQGEPLYLLSKDSGAVKTEGCATTYSPKESCPPSCGLYRDNGCYAELGFVGHHWHRLTKGFTGKPWEQHLADVMNLKRKRIRLNVAGDLPGAGDVIDHERLMHLTEAAVSNGKQAWTYTHKPPTPANLAAIEAATKRGLTINLSADHLWDADRLADEGYPVVVTIPEEMKLPVKTPGGRHVVICPAQVKPDKISCGNCGGENKRALCAKPRDFIIGFIAHGISAKKANAVAWNGLKPLPLFKE